MRLAVRVATCRRSSGMFSGYTADFGLSLGKIECASPWQPVHGCGFVPSWMLPPIAFAWSAWHVAHCTGASFSGCGVFLDSGVAIRAALRRAVDAGMAKLVAIDADAVPGTHPVSYPRGRRGSPSGPVAKKETRRAPRSQMLPPTFSSSVQPYMARSCCLRFHKRNTSCGCNKLTRSSQNSHCLNF